jgi:hypothetical protein
VLKIVERVMREGDVRHGSAAADLGPDDAIALLRAWLVAIDLGCDERELLHLLQEGELSLREHLRRGGIAAVQQRTWDAAIRRLAAGYWLALGRPQPGFDRKVA